ncbi:hypothetical protein N7472_003178 [Penicillium cf. griseofulvum]|uniref:Uncharacterized protein n=1 Tax=Penicillium cf. griseofulvum TaxID=2972120 RepID=A0A9W9MST9_9EURO|nr:hypothetical protein N7472_003178 [Penicillium cf. griseofulvum]
MTQRQSRKVSFQKGTTGVATSLSQSLIPSCHSRKTLVRQKCDEAITHGDFDIRERGDLAYCLLNATSSGASILEAATTRKTTKMPDAPVLSDGKAVRFETWETIICQKLEANSDHYPLPVHRNLYVQSRCEGKAPLPIAT